MSAVYWVYILECKSPTTDQPPTYYTGYTNDLLRRVTEHQTGRGARYTRGRECILRYYETYSSQRAAMRREIDIKQLSHDQKHQLIQEFNEEASTSA